MIGEARCMLLLPHRLVQARVLGEYFDRTLTLANGLGTSAVFIALSLTWFLETRKDKVDKETSIYIGFLQNCPVT